jgi:hypothetical protein
MGASELMEAQSFYEQIFVWTRTDKMLVRYTIMKNIHDGKFGVQSKDYVDPQNSRKSFERFEHQFVELLSETPIEERTPFFGSLEEAIAEFENAFS